MKKQFNEVEYVLSKIDNRRYLVRKLPTKQKAADLIATLNNDVSLLIKDMLAKNPDDPDIKLLYQNFNPENISEGSPDSGYTSYSINKGESIVLCLRQRDNNETFVDKNIILYVFIHELSHISSIHVGHVQEFWALFKKFLNHAIEMGIYKKTDYKANPQPYCGINITSSVV